AVMMKVTLAGAKEPLTMFAVVEIFGAGLGKTLGSIAALIGLGTMFGKLLAESGGANVIAKRFTEFFGPKRVVWCVMALAVVVGLPTWFAVGLVLLLPVLISLTHETKQPFLALAIPLISCMSVMHGLMPPHPGPVALLVSVLFASWSFGTRCGYKPAHVLKFTEQSIAGVGLTLLVVGGGGGFAAVLRDAGVAAAMGKLASALGLPVLLYGWLIAAFIRVSTGSATVSIMTSAGLVAPVLANYP